MAETRNWLDLKDAASADKNTPKQILYVQIKLTFAAHWDCSCSLEI